MTKEKKQKEQQNEVIFVNSFKGGAGKTTLALMHCIDELFHQRKFENVIYIDLDILGTATSYLFEQGKLTTEKAFNNTQKEIKVTLPYETESKELNVVYLSPGLKARSAYGELNYINHQSLAQQRIHQDIITYVKKQVEKRKGNLIVFDCAPGFSEMEQILLGECYGMSWNGLIDVREEYVVTLDTGHIEKCIQCMNDSWTIIKTAPKYRNIRLTLNDIQNYYQYVSPDPQGDIEKQIQEMKEEIKARVRAEDNEQKVEIYFWRYSQEIAVRSIFKHQSIVENQTENYIMTEDSYREL